MAFSRRIEDKLARYHAFFAHPEPGQILITIPPYTFDAGLPEGYAPRTLDTWQPFLDAEAMAERAVACERHFQRATEGVDCDYIPNVNPSYGIGLCSAFLSNAAVIPGKETTWIHPVLHALGEMDKLSLDPLNPWIDFMRRYMNRAKEVSQGDVCVCMLASMAPSDLANAVRGNELFYDLYDDPEGVHRLLSLCVDAVAGLYGLLKSSTAAPDGGFVAGGLWMPGDGLFLSEDGADLCSPDNYAALFQPHTQALLDRIGGAYIHHHAYGWRVHGEIAKLSDRLRFLEFSWDPNKPRPVDHLQDVLAMSQDKPIQIRCTLPDLKRHIDEMKEGRFAVMVNVETVEEAKEAVRIVRKASKV